jgi:phosphoribosylformylglycinamidine synthase
MVSPRVLVLRAPGTNCDVETEFAFQQAGARTERRHINQLIESPAQLADYQVLCLPGGFSYGDDIAAGRILASRIERHLGDAIDQFVASDRLVLGICNGFQVMMRLGIFFPRAVRATASATLARNDHGRFEDRWVYLKTASTQCVFLRDIERMHLPMAHAEGKFVIASEQIADRLAAAGQLALRYCPAPGDSSSGQSADQRLPFPENPNGSDRNVAGICDPTGRVFGLMPHPERHIDPTQHPSWTRRAHQPERGEGFAVFANAVSYFG